MPIDPTISISKIYEEFTEPENTIKIEKNLVFDKDKISEKIFKKYQTKISRIN